MKRNLASLLIALPLLLGAYTASAQTYNIAKPTEDANNWEIQTKAATGNPVTIKYTGNKYVKSVDLKPTNLPLPGEFSVSTTKKVKFSKGNLMYNVNDKTWRFAEHQWDVVGGTVNNAHVGNVSGSSNDNAAGPWIDLFGWGTWSEAGADPQETSTGKAKYETGVTDYGGHGDFTDVCKDGIASGWKTLSHDEWNYLINTRTTTTGIRYSKATVHDVKGLVLLPDEWKGEYQFTNNSTSNQTFVEISDADWATLESEGAVFLPAAGHRYGEFVYNVGNNINYWSKTSRDTEFAYRVEFVELEYTYRRNGLSVRLVWGL